MLWKRWEIGCVENMVFILVVLLEVVKVIGSLLLKKVKFFRILGKSCKFFVISV